MEKVQNNRKKLSKGETMEIVFRLLLFPIDLLASVGGFIKIILISAAQAMISIPVYLFLVFINFLGSKNINDNSNYSYITEFIAYLDTNIADVMIALFVWMLCFFAILIKNIHEQLTDKGYF